MTRGIKKRALNPQHIITQGRDFLSKEFFHGYASITSENQLYLERPRISRLLEKAAENQVVTVVAGAGFGKTRAVYSFVCKYNARTAWIQCSEQDNNGEQFWKNFTSAVSIISRETAKKLEVLEFPATEEQFELYLELRKKDLIPNEKYIFVYDDFQLITEKTVLSFLEKTIFSSFPNITSILISRSEPGFETTEQSAKKLPARITVEELLFSQNEMVSYYMLQGIKTAPQTASAIYHDTEGWAFAIHLAALALKNSPGAAYVPQALRLNIFQLIESEIMPELSAELQHFLIKLSLVKNVTAELLWEIGKDISVIKEMKKVDSFLRFDNRLNSYRIHLLFMNYLQERQKELSEEEKKDVWVKTALWCAANNQKMEAIINYEKAGDYNGVIRILHTLPMMLPNNMARFILDVLNRAPKTIYQNYPETIVIRNRTLVSLGFFEKSREETHGILPRLKALTDNPVKHQILTACYMNLGFIGLIQASYTDQYDFIDYFRQAAIESKLAGIVVKAPDNGAILSSYACRIIAPAPKEKIEKYITALGETIPYSVEALGGCQAGLHELALGEFDFFRGQLSTAEKHLLSGFAKAREMQQYEIENRCLFYLLRIYLSRGSSKDMENVLSQLNEELKEPYYLNRYYYHDIVTGWFHVQTGRYDQLAFWLKSDYEKSGLNSKTRGLEKLVKAKYFFSEKRYPAALALIESREDVEPLLFGDIEMKVLEAVCRYRHLDRSGAFKALTEAYQLAAPAGLFMPFTELGKDMRTLTEAARKSIAAGNNIEGLSQLWLEEIRRSAADYAKKLFRYNGQERLGNTEERFLSTREKEVLTGLSQGLTREEIAGAASISPNTVKSVISSIYNKLGALNQADAVRLATEKGILS